MTRTDPPVLGPDGQDRWRQVERLFHVAMDMPEPARTDFLKTAAGTDTELRTELLALLEADPASRGRLDAVVTAAILAWLRADRR
jgi:hypothetical protein